MLARLLVFEATRPKGRERKATGPMALRYGSPAAEEESTADEPKNTISNQGTGDGIDVAGDLKLNGVTITGTDTAVDGEKDGNSVLTVAATENDGGQHNERIKTENS